MKKFISAILVTAMVITTAFSFGSFSQAAKLNNEFVNVAPDSGEVYFSGDYAEIGKTISIGVNGREGEKFFYKWYLDNEQINDFTDSYTPCDMDIEKMMTAEVYDGNGDLVGKKSMLISELPVVYIEVENRKDIVSKTKTLNAHMKIQGNSLYNDSGILYDGETEIKGRGNTTWNCAKKPYKLKLDSKANLFGMGKNKHWVLLSNPYDTSNLRNDLAYRLSADIGLDSQKSVFVDVVLNGTVVGIYQLCEHVRIDSTRVDIHNWDDAAEDAAKAIYNANKDTMTKDQRDELIDNMTNDLSWTTSDEVKYNGTTYTVSDYYEYPDINGGFLFEIGTGVDAAVSFKTSHGLYVEIDKPEGISDDMLSYLKTYYNAFENALYSPDYCTVYNGKKMRYTDFIDVESFAKGVLINEIFENCDFGKKSTWMSMDLEGKIVYGPVWDMDMSLTGKFDQWNASLRVWLKKMLSDPVFMNEMKNVYWEYRYTDIADLLSDNGEFDTTYEYIYSSAIHNDAIWNCNPDFRNNAADFRWRLQAKISWLDSKFKTVDAAIKPLINGADSSQYIKSPDVNLSLAENTLSYSFTQVPGSVSIFVDGLLVEENNSPAEENSTSVSAGDSSIISVIAYDESGKVMCGSYITTEKYVKTLTVSKIPAKDVFSAGDELALTDFELAAEYSDGSTQTVYPSLIYTYSTDTIGIQDFAYGKVTDEEGSISAVLMYENALVELSLKTELFDNYAEVMQMIDNLPDDVTLQTAIRPLFETKEAYDALSDEAKAKVENADKLSAAMAEFDSYASSTEDAILGGYVYGLYRVNSMNTIVAIVKDKPKKIIVSLTADPNATSTHNKTDVDVFSTKKVGKYQVWTFRQVFKSTVDSYSWRASYSGKGSIYGKDFLHKDYCAESQPVICVNYNRSVMVNAECAFVAETSGVADSIAVSENGAVLASAPANSGKNTELAVKFDKAGKHTVDIYYTVNGVETLYDTVDINVTEPLQEQNELMGVKYDDCSYSALSEVNAVTGKDVESVYLKAGDGTEIPLSAEMKNGYKVWSADFETGKDYVLVVDGETADEAVKNIRLGDVNMDGAINSYDALLVLQFSVEQRVPTEDEVIRSDMNGDGIYNSLDALMILQIVTGEIK